MSIADDVTTSLLAAAHDYRSRGWRVIQLHKVGPDGKTCSCKSGANCTSAGKHPIDKEWQKSEPMSGADIEEAWTGWKAKANVGLATGTESGIWVLDLDPKDDGVEEFRKVLDGRTLPATYTVQTGSGGYHYYFAMPEGVEIRNTQAKVARGVDTRAEGGQVVAAPSVTDKGVYTVLRDCAPSPAPDWLVELVRKDHADLPVITSEDLPRPEDIDPAEWDRLNAYASKVVGRELARLDECREAATPNPADYRGPAWNHTLFEVSCSLLEIANSTWNGYTLGQAQADILARAPRDAEFDDWVVGKTFASARERIGNKARAIPEGRPASTGNELFAGPDVRGRQDPTPGGGEPTTPVVSGNGPDRFFGEKQELLAARLASAILAEGPLGWGRDEDFWSYVDGVWVPDHYVVENRCIALLGDKFRTGHVANVKPIVRTRSYDIQADPHPRYMNFQNGMLDWKSGELHAHSPEFKSTVQFPVPYDTEAECPTFDAFLADVMHEDYVALAWEMLGYLMYSGNDLQVAFMLYGSGGNGKGTLMRVMEELLGRDNVANESLDDLNGNRFSAINLFGRIANLAGDIDGTYQESTANFKKLTGEDMYAGERKFGHRFPFQSWAVPVFSANKIPGSADVTEGYLRRWVVLHFHKRIQNMIPGFSDRLTSELPGIAAKAIPALRRLMERGKFDPQGEAIKAKEEFALQIDQVRQWVDSGQPVPAPEHHCPLADLYAGYRLWADRSGQGRLRESEFSHRLEAIGFPKSRLGGVVGHTGLRVELNTAHQNHQTPASFF